MLCNNHLLKVLCFTVSTIVLKRSPSCCTGAHNTADLFFLTQEVVESRSAKNNSVKGACQRIDFYYLIDYLNI